MEGGGAYRVGDFLNVVGVGTTTGYSAGIVTVTGISNNIGDTLEITSVEPKSNHPYNTLYRITEIGVGKEREIKVASASTISGLTGVGVTDTAAACGHVIGRTLSVSAFNYNAVTGVGVVTTTDRHGLRVDNKIRLDGADNPLYRNNFIVKKVNNQTSFNISVGVGTTTPATSGTLRVFPFGYASAGGNVVVDNENLGGRQRYQYAGITTTLSAAVLTASTTSVEILNIETTDIKIGDYLLVDEELMRVKTSVSSNPITVFRGVLGTRAAE